MKEESSCWIVVDVVVVDAAAAVAVVAAAAAVVDAPERRIPLSWERRLERDQESITGTNCPEIGL